MKAAVFHGPHDVRIDEVPEPRIEQPRDAVLRVTSTAICGSDLHLYNGMFPQTRPMVLGHEFMGVVEEVGPGVDNLKPGDRVVIPFPVADGACWFCRNGLPTACTSSNPEHYGPEGGVLDQKGGGLFGYTDLYGGYSGGQAERVRVPFADFSARKVPDGLRDEQVLFLSDILPTGWTAIDWVAPVRGDTVAVFGAGPVGLMTMKAARLRGAERIIAVDVLDYRLAAAHDLCGALAINAEKDDPVKRILEWTWGRGADVCVDAVGMEPSRGLLEKAKAALHVEKGSIKALETAVRAVRRGGRMSIVGVYGTSYDNFPLGQMFDKGLKIAMGQAPVHRYIDKLLHMVEAGLLRADDIISHVLPLSEAPKAYELFNDKEDRCLKVVLKP